jgi:hypothetical protein
MESFIQSNIRHHQHLTSSTPSFDSTQTFSDAGPMLVVRGAMWAVSCATALFVWTMFLLDYPLFPSAALGSFRELSVFGAQLHHCCNVLRTVAEKWQRFAFIKHNYKHYQNDSSSSPSLEHNYLPPTAQERGGLEWYSRLRGDYVFVMNSFWLAVVDIVFGLICGTALIWWRQEVLGYMSDSYEVLTNTLLKAQIHWLMGWPAGFKLNDNLDHFLGIVFLFYIDKWTGILHRRNY